MLKYFAKSVFFHGNKERLTRFVEREGGKMLTGQRFFLVVKSKKTRQLDRIPFYFLCWYQKVEGGYKICYAPLLSMSGTLRLIALLVVTGLIIQEKQLNPYIIYALPIILYFVNHYIQRSRCIRQFETLCQQ